MSHSLDTLRGEKTEEEKRERPREIKLREGREEKEGRERERSPS